VKKGKKIPKTTLFYVITSGIMAIFLWFFIMTIIDPDVSVSFSAVPVTIKGESELLSDKGYSILSSTDLTVSVRLRGNRNAVLKLSKSDIEVSVDVSQIEDDGESKLICMVTTPYGETLTVTNQTDLKVSFTVDQIVNEEIEVRKNITGELSSGFKLDSAEPQQSTITVHGPRTEVSKISYARVTADLSSLTNSADIISNVELIDNTGEVMTLSYSQVLDTTVTISVKLLAIRELALDLTVVTGGGLTEDDVKIEITPAKITLVGDITAMENIEYLNLGIIDLTADMGDGFTTEMSFILPSGISCLSDSTSATVSVSVNNITTRTISVPATNITISGESALYDVAIIESSINVTVRGNSRLISTLTADDISLSLRLIDYELSEGQIDVTLTAQLIPSINATISGDKPGATLAVVPKSE